MIKSSLCDYSDAYILVQGTMTITVGPAGDAEVARRTDKQNKEVKSKNCAPFTD